MNVDTELKTPVSPVSPQHEGMEIEQQASRKRSHSVMSQQNEAMMAHVQETRSGSIGSVLDFPQQEDGEDLLSPRDWRQVKRGEPPKDASGNYCCMWSDLDPCYMQTFNRKCEWSKHMDKHDRPYRCQHKQCEKLQGFTYSGGLLRHQREVHGQHGGPKATLMCPFEGCRRHAGKGFTRKENLNEHLRRVHHISEQQSLSTQYPAIDTTLGVDDMDPPTARMSDDLELGASVLGAGKRKRIEADMDDFIAATNIDELHAEIKRLREENDQKDERIQRLEAERLEQDDKLRQLQAVVEQKSILE